MSADEDDDIPAVARPNPAELAFDLEAALASVVTIRSEIAADAFTAAALGTERRGHGVVIGRDGLVLTIGYLIAEADRLWLTTTAGRVAAGHIVAYDPLTGFGLVQALGRLGAAPLPLGSTKALIPGEPVVVAGGGGLRDALSARLIARRPFAGYWEYVLDEALFTAPAHPRWGGAACIDADGRLVGIGSLLVQEASREGGVVGNMIVPIDLLPPILDDLLRYGRQNRPPQPWLGVYAADTPEGIVVTGLAANGPAAAAGLAEGDILLQLDGEAARDLLDFWRKLWAKGTAGVTVRIMVLRNGRQQVLTCRTADRDRFLKQPSLH